MGNSFVLFRVRVLLVLLAALFLVGCESGETSTSGSASGGGRSFGGLTTHSFAREVNLSVQRNEFSAPNSPFIEITAEDEQAYRQFEGVRSQTSNDRFVQLNYSVRDGVGEGYELLTDDPSGELTAYTPRSAEDTVFDGVFDKFGSVFLVRSSENGVGQFSCTVTYDWTLPADDSERPTLVSVNGVGITFGDYAAESPQYAEAEGDTVQLVYDITGSTTATAIEEYSWTATVNGTTVGEGTSGQVSQLILPPPAFKSTVSGLHQVTTTSSGSSNVIEVGLTQPDDTYSWSYYQRGLVFTEEFPEVDLESEEPITIENTVAWSDDVPLVDFVTWEVYSTAGVGFNRIGGTGNEILAVWDPVKGELTRPRAAEEGEEPELEPVPFEVSASTTVYDGPQHADREALVYRLVHGPFNMPGLEKLRILPPDVTPDNPFQGDVQSVQVVADIILFDEESIESDVAWEVHIVDSAGEPVKENIASGRGCLIIADWDGTGEDELPVPDPASHQFLLEASLCGGGVVGSRSVQGVRAQSTCDNLKDFDTRLAQMNAVPKLEIFPEAVAPPIADSEDDSSAPSDAARKRLGTVHKLENWQLQADLSGVPESERPTELFVQMESQISGVKPPLATLTGGKATGIYTGQLTATQTDGLIKRERPATGASSTYLDAETTFSSGSVLSEDHTTTFFSMLSGLLAQSPKDAGSPNLVTFAKPRQGLGRLIPFDTSEIEEDEAFLDFNNLSQFGFEAVTFTMSKADNPVLDIDTIATLKVQNPASIVHTVTFGGTNAFLDLGLAGTDGNSNSGFFDPESLRPLEFLPKTWIIEGCNALDAYDYNNNRNDPADPVSGRISPGAQWHQETRKGDTILLGYSHPVPEKLVDVVQEEFGRELNRLSAKVPPALLQQYAWLSANLNVYEDNLQNFNIRGSLAACAWDDKNYYFIAYWPPYSQTRVERLMDAVRESRGELTRRILGFYSIPVTELRQFPSVTEASKLPTENQVRIPE